MSIHNRHLSGIKYLYDIPEFNLKCPAHSLPQQQHFHPVQVFISYSSFCLVKDEEGRRQEAETLCKKYKLHSNGWTSVSWQLLNGLDVRWWGGSRGWSLKQGCDWTLESLTCSRHVVKASPPTPSPPALQGWRRQ